MLRVAITLPFCSKLSVLQVLEQLPAHLLISVFRASGLNLLQSLTLLPTIHHHSALCAHFPEITHDKSLRLTEAFVSARHVSGQPPGVQEASGRCYLQPLFEAVRGMHELRELHIWANQSVSPAHAALVSLQRAITSLLELTSLLLEGRLVALAFDGISAALSSCRKLQSISLHIPRATGAPVPESYHIGGLRLGALFQSLKLLSLIHISEPTRPY